MKKVTILGLHLNYGGVEQAIANLANALSNDFEVELAITYKLGKPAFFLNSNIKITYLTIIGLKLMLFYLNIISMKISEENNYH